MPPGRGDRGDAGMMAGKPGAMHQEVLGSVATTLGVTPEALRTELAWKSLDGVAQAHGVGVATMKASSSLRCRSGLMPRWRLARLRPNVRRR